MTRITLADVPCDRRRLLIGAGAVATVLLDTKFVSAGAATAFSGRRVLVMVDLPGCPYCQRWRRDVEQGYRNSSEGRFAPLEVRVRGHRDLAGIRNLVFAPTFVLLDDGREVGRIIGYSGPDLFWEEIARLFAQAGYSN